MKGIVLRWFFVCVGWCVISVSVAVAQEKSAEHFSETEMLDFSLSRLKESMKKTMQDNERLAFENGQLRMEIQDLLYLKKSLTVQQDINVAEQAPFNLSERRMQRPVSVKGVPDRLRRTKDLIGALEGVIFQLKGNVHMMQEEKGADEFKSRRNNLLKNRAESIRRLTRLQKLRITLDKRHAVMQRKVGRLLREQDELWRVLGVREQASSGLF